MRSAGVQAASVPPGATSRGARTQRPSAPATGASGHEDAVGAGPGDERPVGGPARQGRARGAGDEALGDADALGRRGRRRPGHAPHLEVAVLAIGGTPVGRGLEQDEVAGAADVEAVEVGQVVRDADPARQRRGDAVGRPAPRSRPGGRRPGAGPARRSSAASGARRSSGAARPGSWTSGVGASPKRMDVVAAARGGRAAGRASSSQATVRRPRSRRSSARRA